jgi:general transcription factor IIIA
MLSYFPTWSALQHHIRTVHPPTCTHSSCQGRTFTSQKGLRAHHKLHEERELEKELAAGMAAEDDDMDSMEPPLKRRRGGEIGRDWKCDVDGCDKDFKSVSAFLSLSQ